MYFSCFPKHVTIRPYVGSYLPHNLSTDQTSQWYLISPLAGTTLPRATSISIRIALTFTCPFLNICSSHIRVQDSGE